MKKSAREYAERHLNWNKNAAILNQIVRQVKADPNKSVNYNKYKGPALGLSFSRRPNGSCLAKRIPRKLSRMYYGLDSVR